MTSSAVHNILFIELLGGIGDVLIALSAIQALARSHSQAQMTVLTLPPGGKLLESDPLITCVVYADRNNPRKSVEKLLASQNFDLIVSDTNYDGIEQVIQQSGALHCVTNLWREPPTNQLVSDRFIQILLAEKVIHRQAIAKIYLQLPLLKQQRAQAALCHYPRPLVFLIPDAGMSIKRWNPINFITLGKALRQAYGATLLIPVGADVEQATTIADGIGNNAYIFPRGELVDLAAALACASLIIAADTGPARIAAALNIPTIALFGPSWYGRYRQLQPHINLQGYPQCPERNPSNFTEQSCWYSGICPLQQRWENCVDDISPLDVFAAAESFLGVWGE
ncbi:glycosyltransferase family 9 protein [Gloeocapsopsis dulcis]|uniref:Glycosyl transferase n=1 Tax=Gloeocapsopsis dulcis AAB1 = 1H9 TaxID=1433147 RepID=A0A6N8G298_9CHRO|nr:glycosyltransferase family 9 protein [Gloeocapsopsis dulcis]MUL38296.1 glycosyl transferase [Gloeocapsopsis dulcis AAB1 = 1H9]WNN91205.1 glycosyltransferase family 9 protein [Gloeocapsopsis dulcis]